jgi:DNA-binding NarL/FixJ family response regulator
VLGDGEPPDGRPPPAGDAVDMKAQATAASPSTLTRVVLAISHARTRAAIRSALEGHGVAVVAEVSSPLHVAQEARRAHADVILFDLRLASSGASPSLKELVASVPDVPVIAIGLEEDPAFRRAALRSGATAHMLIDAAPDDYASAVEAARAGSTHVR